MNTKLKPWTIKQLYDSMLEALRLCQTDLERQMCKTICKKEIREKAKEFKKTRKLTPLEVAILEKIDAPEPSKSDFRFARTVIYPGDPLY